MSPKYILYIDDTGSRDPDRSALSSRMDLMDCFALGGFLLKDEDIPEFRAKHTVFCAQWHIDYPLHSSSIRGGHRKFGWLRRNRETEEVFLSSLEELLLSLPIVCIAAIIHRPGYLIRYRQTYRERLWFMCRTAFSILVERSAKYARDNGRKLEIVFEGTGKREDRDIKAYLKALKNQGSPFAQQNSEGYRPLTPEDYRKIILGEPHEQSKLSPMLQIADLVLYPIAKAGYEKSYRPYQRLREAGKLIDSYFEGEHVLRRGIKYSCFDGF
jgi:hypothetical protein